MPRLFVPFVPESQRVISLTGDSARYLTLVLRCGAGDELTLFDSHGARYRAVIRRAEKTKVSVELLEALPPEPEPEPGIVVVQGILKGQKMDLVVQKATELGVREIIPLVTERTQVRGTRKQPRWQKIALEASRQSGRAVVPAVHPPVDIRQWLASLRGTVQGLLFWEEGGAPLKDAFACHKGRPFHVVIGPEGGFTPEEVCLAEERGLVVATLGRRILRAETAAIAAVALVAFLMAG